MHTANVSDILTTTISHYYYCKHHVSAFCKNAQEKSEEEKDYRNTICEQWHSIVF